MRAAWVLVALFVCGCDDGAKPSTETAPPKPTAAAPAPGTATAKASAAASAAPSAAAAPSASASAAAKAGPPYPIAGFTPIADACADAHLFVATMPVNATNDYRWPFFRQALLANPELRSALRAPIATHDYGPLTGGKAASKALWVACRSGKDCNALAAMYKAMVPSSAPQPFCAKDKDDRPKDLGPTGERVDFEGVIVDDAGAPASDLPAADEVVSACVRLAACARRADPTASGDAGLECQKKPTDFKTGCARKPDCEAVLLCASH